MKKLSESNHQLINKQSQAGINDKNKNNSHELNLKPQLNPELLETVDEETRRKLKKKTYLDQDKDELLDEDVVQTKDKATRFERKKNIKILNNSVLKEINNEADELPDEITNMKSRKNRIYKEIEKIEEKNMIRRRITKREKKAMNLNNKNSEDEFNDFTEMNDIKGMFVKKNQKRIKREKF